jgi:type IVB pilus formation R64 PilN family outer membrane protein
MTKLRILAFAIAAISTAGCSTFKKVNTIDEKVRDQYKNVTNRLVNIKIYRRKKSGETVVYLNDQWVSLEPIKVKTKVAGPISKCRIKIATNEPISILEFGQIVTKYCGIPVRVTSDALSAIDHPFSNDLNLAGSSTSPIMQSASGMPQQPGASYMLQSASERMAANPRLVDINYNGELTGLLNMISARFGLSWKFDDGLIKIYNLDTETFSLNAIASSTEMRSDVQSGTTMVNGVSGGATQGASNNGISGQSTSNQNTTVTLKTAIWDDVKKTLDSMISVKGRCSTSASTGSITCTDNTDVLSRIRTYVEKENVTLTKQVLFQIRILSVSLSNSDSFGISWNAVYQALSNKYGVKLSSAFTAPQGATTGTVTIPQNSKSPWQGTDVILSALAEQGSVSIIKQPTVSTLNLQAVPVQVAKQNGFVPGSQTTTTPNVGTTTTFQTGIITTGFNMSLLPYVMSDNRMLLQFSINLSNLRNIRTVKDTGSGGGFAEVPELDLPINSSQKVRLNPGETLMLSGFDQEDNLADYKGVDSPKNFLFGGGVKGNRSRSTLVVLITPTVME